MAKKYSLDTNIFFLAGQEDGFDPYSWYNLPDCTQEDNEAEFILEITIADKITLDKFADHIGQTNLKYDTKLNTKSIWYPKLIMGERGHTAKYMWVDESLINFGDNA